MGRQCGDRSGDALGVARQEQDCGRPCDERGWDVLPVYSDNDVSAADPRKTRPEYQRSMKTLADGLFTEAALVLVP
jgi:DNA invertase Pin-like site-specific DNA recombinase